MSLLKTISEKHARGKVKKIYQDIKKTRKIKKIPNFWKTIANDPDTLERTWSSLQQVMKKGSLDLLTKELIAVVAMANETNRLVESYQVEIDKFLK